mgnify:CR=1 FL=1
MSELTATTTDDRCRCRPAPSVTGPPRAERIVPATSALEIGQLRVSFNSPLFVWDTSGLIDRTPSFPGNANMYSMTTSAIRGTLSVEVSRMGVSISPSSCT